MINKILKSRFLIALLIIALLLPCLIAVPVTASGSYPYAAGDSEVSSALNYLRAQQATDGKIADFATSAWAAMAIAAAGEDPDTWKVGSNPSVVDYLSANSGSAASANDYSRMILAIAAAGEDPSSFGGRNFVSLLESFYDGTQIGDSSLLNDDIWGTLALVASGLDTATSDALQDSVSFILDNQNGDGGWSWGVGQDSDVDDTAAAIMALIAAGEPAGSSPIVEALTYTKLTQMNNGGFESWGSTNSATNAWGICSIAAADQDPTDAGWESGTGNDPVDDLLSFRNGDGSFNWTPSTPSNMALMTSYAIQALLGKPYPVAVLSPQEPGPGVNVDVRIEGQNSTIWSGRVTVETSVIDDDEGNPHQFDQPTVLGALDEAAQAGDFLYVVKNTAYGLYVYSINGEDPAGMAGWTYRVNYYSPSVGAADFILSQTSPPSAPHEEVLFAYSEWGQSPLKVEVDDTTPEVGDTFTVTVTEYDDDTNTWSPAVDATLYADQDYTTDENGEVAIAIGDDLTFEVYAEKEGCIRSNRVTVNVGEGSTQTNTSQAVGMTADIIPAISFSVSPGSINFGNKLGPGDISTPVTMTLTNNGAWKLRITAQVSDTAQNLYVSGLKLNGTAWTAFSTSVLRNNNNTCQAVLTVPDNYARTGNQNGTIIFWAVDGR